jgi:hypothetical protein
MEVIPEIQLPVDTARAAIVGAGVAVFIPGFVPTNGQGWAAPFSSRNIAAELENPAHILPQHKR